MGCGGFVRYSKISAGCPLCAKSRHYAVQQKLFDHLVGAQQNRSGHIDTEHLRGLQIDDRLEFGGLFDGNIAGFRALENLIHEEGGAAKKSENFTP